MKKIYTIIMFLLTICMLFALGYSIVEYQAFSKEFYYEQFKINDTYNETRLDKNELHRLTDNIMGYLDGTKEKLDTNVTIDNEEKELFTDIEKQHMADVLELFNKFRTFRKVAFLLFFAVLFIGVFYFKFGLKYYLKLILISVLAFLGFILILAVFAVFDFENFWNFFHTVMFDNLLWRVEDNRSYMILIFNENFFYNFVIKLAEYFIIYIIIIITTCVLGIKRLGKIK